MKARTKARRRAKPGRAASQPGFLALPEDRRSTFNALTLCRTDRQKSRPVSPTESVYAPMTEIERRLLTAMKTIRAVPDRDRRFQIMKGASIPYLQEYMDAYSSADVSVAEFTPSPRDVSDCLVALSWVRHVDRKKWKIMWLRSFGFSFGLIAKYIGRSDETARRWYREGITDAWAAANGPGNVPRVRRA